MPIQDIDHYAYNVLAESLSRVNGVSQVNIAGQQIPAAHVQVNPDALASRGISLEDVRTALVNATTDLPKGNLEGKRQEFTLDTNDQLFDAAAFRNIIAAYRNGAPVQIKDIGEVDQLLAVGAHRRLVRRQADRAAADRARAGRQHDQGGGRDQGDDAGAGGVDPALGACRSGVRPLDQHPRLRSPTSR